MLYNQILRLKIFYIDGKKWPKAGNKAVGASKWAEVVVGGVIWAQKSATTLLLMQREQAEMVGITKYKCTVHFGIAKTVFLNSFFRKTQRWEEKNCLC